MTCNEWNYWESCMDHKDQLVRPDSVDDFLRVNTRVRVVLLRRLGANKHILDDPKHSP